MQYAVDTETDHAHVALRFEVDVRGALIERVLPEPVDDVDDVLVVGIELAVAGAHFDQLLEIVAQRGVGGALVARALDRLGQREELRGVLLDIERVGDHQLDQAARDARNLFFPFEIERVRRGHGQLGLGHVHREDVEACRVGGRHDVGHAGEVGFQWIDAEKRQLHLARHPFREPVQRQRAMRRMRRLQLALRHRHQRVHGRCGVVQNRRSLRVLLLGMGLVDDPVGHQPTEDMLQI